MTLASAIYTGQVRHRRREPEHRFTFPLFMVYLDLAELDTVLSMSPWWGTSPLHPARFRREDYLQRDDLSLIDSVRRIVCEHLGRTPNGPIRMLTHLRYFGYIFNPVTFYYCFDKHERIDAVVAEITNTPWNERHAYVLDARLATPSGSALRWRFGKHFHISPFLPMNLDYDWCIGRPGPDVFIHMNLLSRDGTRTFDATLTLARRELSPATMRRALFRYPFMTAQVIAKIHVEALRLWLKRARIHPHPATTPLAPLLPKETNP